MRSAYGVLQGSIESSPGEIAFVKEADYRTIREYPWNSDQKLEACDSASFYTVRPTKQKDDTADVDSAKQQVDTIL
jgi:hypothetical protein